MAEIVFGFASSHGPQLNMAPSQWPLLVEKDQRDPRMDYQELLRRARPGMDLEITPEKMEARAAANERGMAALRDKLLEAAPDVIVVVGDDQHEQFLDDNMPIFAIYHGEEMSTVQRRAPWADNGARPEDSRPTIKGEPDLAMHLITELCGEGFDIARTNKQREGIGLGHAFINPYMRYLPDRDMPIVPFMVNTYFPPNTPTPKRCYGLGQALRNAIESWKSNQRVCLVASGRSPAEGELEAVCRAADWLAAVQNQDGSLFKWYPPGSGGLWRRVLSRVVPTKVADASAQALRIWKVLGVHSGHVARGEGYLQSLAWRDGGLPNHVRTLGPLLRVQRRVYTWPTFFWQHALTLRPGNFESANEIF